MVKKEIDKNYLNQISQLDLRWIKFEVVNNNIKPILSTSVLFSWLWERLKLLMYLWKLISEKTIKSVKDIVFYLEKSESKRIQMLWLLNKEVEREPLLSKYIKNKEFPYKIEELDKILEEDPYLIVDKDWNRKNLIFDFIEKVQNLVWFKFNSKMPRTIWTNLTAVKKWLKENDKTLEELEWFFNNVFSRYIYDWYEHKSIVWFLKAADDYFYNPDKYQLLVKALIYYIVERWENKWAKAVGSSFQKNNQTIKSILENIWWDLDKFNIILKDYSRYSKNNWLNWTINTIFNNLYTKYAKYVVTEIKSIESKETSIEYSKEFKQYIVENKITDKDLIKQYNNIYNAEWIDWLKEL